MNKDVFTKVTMITFCLRIKIKQNFCLITAVVTVTKWTDVDVITTLNKCDKPNHIHPLQPGDS